MSAMSGPLFLDTLQKLDGQTESILTAARLVRGGWAEGKKWQFSNSECLASQHSVSRSDGIQSPKYAEICLTGPRGRQVLIVSSRKTAEDKETGSEKKADEAQQTEHASSENRQANSMTGLCIRVRATGCRTTYRQSRGVKAPVLPVIAEI